MGKMGSRQSETEGKKDECDDKKKSVGKGSQVGFNVEEQDGPVNGNGNTEINDKERRVRRRCKGRVTPDRKWTKNRQQYIQKVKKLDQTVLIFTVTVSRTDPQPLGFSDRLRELERKRRQIKRQCDFFGQFDNTCPSLTPPTAPRNRMERI